MSSRSTTLSETGSSSSPQQTPAVGHPKVLEAYRNAHLDPAEEYEPTPSEIAEWRFFQRLDKQKTLRHQIHQIYRTKVGSKEFILYNEILIGTDRMGNTFTHPRLVGRYNHPEFHNRYDEDSGQPEPTKLTGRKVVYEIPFSKEELQKIYDLDTEDSDPILVVTSGAVKYTGPFSQMDFMNKSFDDLMIKGQTGSYPQVKRGLSGNEQVKPES